MDLSAVSNNSSDIQSLLINSLSGTNRVNGGNNAQNQTAEYARKGEPMYMEEMDADGDGVVSLDEFRDYCKSKGINSREMIKMSQMASAFRTMQAETETIDYISKLVPKVHPNLKQADSESSFLKQEDNKFNISADSNHEKKVSYNEYMAFCEQNTAVQDLKVNTKFEEDDDGTLKITNSGKGINLYKQNSKHILKSTFEKEI